MTQMRGGVEELSRQLAEQLDARIVPRQEEAATSKVFEKILILESTESSSFCKNLLGNTIAAPKTA